ncbi:MAG TPA: hypothetical protein PLU79_00395 [Burkholderiaceae bacterium]|nr:hypothetical protein [Burkholderiaceae bacterium]
MAVRAIQTRPSRQIVMVEHIASVDIFPEGVALRDDRKRIVGWFETSNVEHQDRISDIMLEILENPRRAKKPDFSFLEEAPSANAGTAAPAVASARALAAQPTRQNGSGTSSAGSTGSSSSAS